MSALTFRDPCSGVAYQRQLRDRFTSEAPPPVPLDLASSRVRLVDRAIAEQIILRYEWLGTMAKTSHHYGLFFGPYCAGVCCVCGNGSATVATTTHAAFGVQQSEVAVLARGACVHWSPDGANSRLVSWTCKLLRHDSRAKLIVAYADPNAGEVGTIYQACGWHYIGKTEPTPQIIAPTGRVYNVKITGDMARSRGGTSAFWRKRLLEAGWRLFDGSAKHRYVCILDNKDKALRAKVLAMQQPYPKRGRDNGSTPVRADSLSVAGTTEAGDSAPTGVSGSNPTRPLQQTSA